MGFLKKQRAKSQYQKDLSNYEAQLAHWESETEHVDTLLYMATNLEDVYSQAAEAGFTVRLKKDEHILIGLRGGTGLVEPRSGGGSYQGGSRGTSIRVAKGVSFRVGSHAGTYVPNPDVEKAIDTDGDVYITTQRVLYTSPGRNREWAYRSTVDVYHADNWSGSTYGLTYMAVTNRQKTSGFGYPMEHARTVRDRLLLGMAVFDDTVEDLISGLQAQANELKGQRPTEPARPQILDE